MNNLYELLLDQEIVRVKLVLDIRNLNFLMNNNNTAIIQNDINDNENVEEINSLKIVTSAGTKLETPIYLVEQWQIRNLIGILHHILSLLFSDICIYLININIIVYHCYCYYFYYLSFI